LSFEPTPRFDHPKSDVTEDMIRRLAYSRSVAVCLSGSLSSQFNTTRRPSNGDSLGNYSTLPLDTNGNARIGSNPFSHGIGATGSTAIFVGIDETVGVEGQETAQTNIR
jgi:hypothetical protein